MDDLDGSTGFCITEGQASEELAGMMDGRTGLTRNVIGEFFVLFHFLLFEISRL